MKNHLILLLLIATLRNSAASGDLELFETPDAKEGPILAAIQNAKSSVRVEVYQLTDNDVIQALVSAHAKGLPVQVILNQGFFDSKTNKMSYDGGVNKATFDQLKAAGVDVNWAPHSFRFTHEKAIIVDVDQPSQEVEI